MDFLRNNADKFEVGDLIVDYVKFYVIPNGTNPLGKIVNRNSRICTNTRKMVYVEAK